MNTQNEQRKAVDVKVIKGLDAGVFGDQDVENKALNVDDEAVDVEIRCLNELLVSVVGGRELAGTRTRSLVGPGENYGSVMLALDVTLKNPREEIHLVAKLCPPNEFIKKMFNIPVTYKKEVGFYSEVVPTLRRFQEERGCGEVLDITPRYYGSRYSLDERAKEVDDDACLLLENLKARGYETGDRMRGFDLPTAEMYVRDLAAFHAVSNALARAHPERFTAKITPHIIQHITAESFPEEMRAGMIDVILDAARKHPECAQHTTRLRALLAANARNFTAQEPARAPFTTVIHNDCWVNNSMQQHANGKPTKNALIDFQLITHGNPARDLVFFIYTSLSNHLIKTQYNHLTQLYYNTFIATLRDLKINTDEHTRDAFMKSIDDAVNWTECFHILSMMHPIYLEKDKVKDLGDINMDSIVTNAGFSDAYYSRVWFTIMDFVDKGWV